MAALSVVSLRPNRGYSVDLRMDMLTTRRSVGGISMWDNGVAYDKRTLRATWTLPVATALTWSAYFNGATSYRGEQFQFDLGAGNIGFYPAGPDKGDTGLFTMRLIKPPEISGWQIEPKGYCNLTLTAQYVSSSAFALPTQVSEGDFQIGTIAGLRWPEDGYAPEADRGWGLSVARGSGVGVIDVGTARDVFYSSWTQPCNQSKAAALVNHLQNVARGADTTIAAPDNFFLFGCENGGANAYTCNLASGDQSETVITMTHVNHNRWDIPLRFWMQEVVVA